MKACFHRGGGKPLHLLRHEGFCSNFLYCKPLLFVFIYSCTTILLTWSWPWDLAWRECRWVGVGGAHCSWEYHRNLGSRPQDISELDPCLLDSGFQAKWKDFHAPLRLVVHTYFPHAHCLTHGSHGKKIFCLNFGHCKVTCTSLSL